MIYEDLLVLWLAYLLWEFLPSYVFFEGAFVLKFILFIGKELSFFILPVILNKRFFEKYFLILSFIFFALDLSFFGLKGLLEPYYFSTLLILFWYLHYYIWIRIIYARLSLNYMRILLGLLLPFFILLTIDEILQYFDIHFSGQFLVLLILILIFTPYFVIKIWPVYKLPLSPLRETLLQFIKKEGIKIKEIYVIPTLGEKFYTAGVVGFIPPFRYLFFSKGLLEILDLDEIIGVVAHEIGHIKKRHGLYLFLLLLTFPLFLLNSFSLLFFPLPLIFKNSDNFLSFLKGPYGILFEVFLGICLLFLSFLFLRLILAYFMRSFEREADLYGLSLLQTPDPLITSLYKIGEISGQLYRKSWHHYGLWERIQYLKYASLNPWILQKHSFLIRKRILLWILFNLALLGVLSIFDSEMIDIILKIFIH